MIIELTPEQIDFLKQVLDSVQIGGTPPQVREALRLIDAIQEKLSPHEPEPPNYDDMMRSVRKEVQQSGQAGTTGDPLPAPPYTPAKVQNL